GADRGGTRARLPVAGAPPHAAPGRVRPLQPLALRGRAGRARARARAKGAVEGALWPHRRLRSAARPARHHRAQVFPPYHEARAEGAAPRAREGSEERLEAEPERLEGARLLGEYTEAYEDAISRTAAKHAPWMVVPANAKWYRNLVIAESIVEALRAHRKGWRRKLQSMAEEAKATLASYRRKK